MQPTPSPLALLRDPGLLKTDALIGGEWVAAGVANPSRFDVIDPATGAKLADVANLGAVDCHNAIMAADKAGAAWISKTNGMPNVRDLIPGLTFVEPEVFRTIFNNHQKLIEGCFWTLFVVVKFYIVAGLLYFSVGPRKMIVTLIIMFLISTIFGLMQAHLPSELEVRLGTILHYLNYKHYGWFAAGALFYRYYSLKNVTNFLMGLLIALLSARALDGFLSLSMIFATTLVLIFAVSIFNPTLQKLLSNKFLGLIGFTSYPLYLIHENAMISMIIQLHNQYDWMPLFLLPLLPILGLIFVAWIVARYLEPVVRQFIKNLLLLLRTNSARVV